MRILILSNSGMGLYKFRRELLEVLAIEHDVWFCVPQDDFVELLISTGAKFIDNKLLDRHGINPIQEINLIYFYRKILKKLKPDIVFTYTIKPNVYGGMQCAVLRIPYVANITGLGTAVENSGLMQIITLNLYNRGLRRAQKVFFQNCANKDFMISNGVNLLAYDILPGSGVNLNQYYVLPYPKNDTVDFIFVARIMKEKGIDHYIDAAKEVRARHPETRFHICGPCEQGYEEKLRELHDKGIVIYHGLVADMSEIYKLSSCTVHPTYYPEGISNVLLESAASGRPIITTNRSGCREVVDDGINGYLIEQCNSADLIEKIEFFLSLSISQREAMGLLGRKKVEEQFDRKIVIEKYLKELSLVQDNGL